MESTFKHHPVPDESQRVVEQLLEINDLIQEFRSKLEQTVKSHPNSNSLIEGANRLPQSSPEHGYTRMYRETIYAIDDLTRGLDNLSLSSVECLGVLTERIQQLSDLSRHKSLNLAELGRDIKDLLYIPASKDPDKTLLGLLRNKLNQLFNPYSENHKQVITTTFLVALSQVKSNI